MIHETKGFDELESIKKAAAERWINAVNVDQKYGYWQYAVVKKPEEVRKCLDNARKRSGSVFEVGRIETKISVGR